MAILDSLSVTKTKCWLSCREPVVIKGPSFPIHAHLRLEGLVGSPGGLKAKEALEGWLERGLRELLGSKGWNGEAVELGGVLGTGWWARLKELMAEFKLVYTVSWLCGGCLNR